MGLNNRFMFSCSSFQNYLSLLVFPAAPLFHFPTRSLCLPHTHILSHSFALTYSVLSISFGCSPDCYKHTKQASKQAGRQASHSFISLSVHEKKIWAFNLCAWVSIWFYTNVYHGPSCLSVCVPCSDFYYWKLSKQRI